MQKARNQAMFVEISGKLSVTQARCFVKLACAPYMFLSIESFSTNIHTSLYIYGERERAVGNGQVLIV